MASSQQKTEKKIEASWSWYDDQGGLDMLTKFDERNRGHQSCMENGGGGGEDFLDQAFTHEMKFMFGDEEDNTKDEIEVTAGMHKMKLFPEGTLKEFRKSKASPKKNSIAAPVEPLQGRGRGRRLQERKEKFRVGQRRPFEIVEETMEGKMVGAEGREVLEDVKMGDEPHKTMETTSSGIGLSEDIVNCSVSSTSFCGGDAGVRTKRDNGGILGAADILGPSRDHKTLTTIFNASLSSVPSRPPSEKTDVTTTKLQAGSGKGKKNRKWKRVEL